MLFNIITIFPHIFDSYIQESIIKRAQEKKLVSIRVHDLRDFTSDKHKTVDDKPYGGGAGMVLKPQPILDAVTKIRNQKSEIKNSKVVILSAKGKLFTQSMARSWAKKHDSVLFISGRYEGIDERVKKVLKAEEVSIGPYVLTDGDVAAMVIISAVTRLIPGVITFESLEEESHWNQVLKKETSEKKGGALEYPHYTRPEVLEYNGKTYRVPKVLMSGNHKGIKEWRDKNRRS
jgi:tRNA (guanine37-N1)-methyltransferase